MFDDENFGEPWSAQRRRNRVFADSRDDGAANMEAWKAGIAAAKSGDERGILRALESARGSALILNRRGKPARNPCSKAALALRADPGAWRRMKEGACGRWGSEFSDPDWLPYAVDIFEYLWAASPEGMAKAAKLWRARQQQEPQRWASSPFLCRPYESPAAPRSALMMAIVRHFQPENYRVSLAGEPSPIDMSIDAGAEREALAEILVESCVACVEELWGYEEESGAKRMRGESVWARGGSAYGVGWFGAQIPLSAPGELPPGGAELGQSGAPAEDGQKGAAKKSPRGFAEGQKAKGMCALELAMERAMGEALALGPQAADLACRKMVLGPGSGHGDAEKGAALALAAWVGAYPDRPEGLPFEACDWTRASRLFGLCAKAGVSDGSLGRWLALRGVHWSAPAAIDRFGGLAARPPKWSYERSDYFGVSAWGESLAKEELARWTPLEWALFERPAAAREACMAGAALAEGVERAFGIIQEQSKGELRGAAFAGGIGKALSWAEACRLAECSGKARPAPSKRPLSL